MNKTLKIKGMVCKRCIDTVTSIFETEGFKVKRVELGEIEFTSENTPEKEEVVKELLRREGFEVLDDKHSRVINKVKFLIEALLNDTQKHQKNYSEVITSNINMEYDSISALFTQTEGTTIEQYIIRKRIEKVKEMLALAELSLTDIAFEMGYSSVHHLSNQFKKITGMSPSAYQKLKFEQ